VKKILRSKKGDNNYDVDERTNDGQTALMLAAQLGHREILRLLMENGADIESAGENGNTALIAHIPSR
jgi:ankyrin repeat protein